MFFKWEAVLVTRSLLSDLKSVFPITEPELTDHNFQQGWCSGLVLEKWLHSSLANTVQAQGSLRNTLEKVPFTLSEEGRKLAIANEVNIKCHAIWHHTWEWGQMHLSTPDSHHHSRVQVLRHLNAYLYQSQTMWP